MTGAYRSAQLCIGGVWSPASDGRTRPVLSPADDSLIGTVPVATDADIDRTLLCAQAGFEVWRSMPPIRRTDILMRGAQLLRERAEDLTRLACMEEGQCFEEGKTYVARAAEVVEWDAAEGRRVYGRIVPSEPGLRLMVMREPIGVVAAFTPWNAPVFTPCRKIGSALAAGCALIMKAAEEAPASTAAVVQCFLDAGVPPGALNLLYGDPEHISARLIASPVVRMITLTGSIAVGKQLAGLAAAQMKPCVMELGGHAPVIVCEDADVEDAARRIAAVKFRNAGQACLSPSRFWVAEQVFQHFLDVFAAEVSKLKVGSPFEPGVTMGPVANARRLAAVQALTQDALSHGATLVAGGQRIGTRGCFFSPTVLADVPASARVLFEEPFGPIAVVNRFADLDQVLAQANALPYGLAAYVFTRSATQADRIASRLEFGTVGINHLVVSTSGLPFGGVKASGYGREGGTEGVESYTVAKTITHLLA